MSLPALTFECYQMESGVWCKRRANGLRGACVADEALLWQHLQAAQAALGQKPQPSVDVAELVRENERLTKDCDALRLAYDGKDQALRGAHRLIVSLRQENDELRANQRRKPGRKPRSDAAGAEEQALAPPEHECNPLDEDL